MHPGPLAPDLDLATPSLAMGQILLAPLLQLSRRR
jgi:hypothetical protein